MNEKNLKPLDKRTKKEQREIAQIGGVASGESRRQKKAMKERLLLLMEEPTQADPNTTNGDKMAASLMAAAISGDLKAIRLIGDYLGDFKQQIQIEDTTLQMTTEEAEAIYNSYIAKRAAEIDKAINNQLETGEPCNTPLMGNPSKVFQLAVDVLKKQPEQVMQEFMAAAFGTLDI